MAKTPETSDFCEACGRPRGPADDARDSALCGPCLDAHVYCLGMVIAHLGDREGANKQENGKWGA